jgi:hypothetical protein
VDLGFFASPDYTKDFVVDVSGRTFQASAYETQSYQARIAPRLRFSDKFFVTYSFLYRIDMNDLGYACDSNGVSGDPVIIFGRRDVRNITNTLNATYTFSNKVNLSMRLRHYWFKVDYNTFYDLTHDGNLAPTDYFVNDYDFNFNAFNVEMFFTWYFAPGSEMSIVWKNAITNYDDPAIRNYFDNFRRTLTSPASNSLSIKLLYFLDYQYFKKKNRQSI